MAQVKNILLLLSVLLLCSCKTFYITEKSTFTIPRNNKYILPSGYENGLHHTVNKIKTNDSTQIEVWTIATDNPENLFFFFPANANHLFEFKSFLEKLSTKTNSKIIAIHYRGFGNSSGKPSFETTFADNNFIFSKEIPFFKNYKQISVIGISIGTLFSGNITSLHPEKIDNLILLSTFSTPNKMLSEGKRIHVPFYAKPFIKIKAETKLHKLNNIDFLQDYHNKLLIVQAKDDKETGYLMGKELFGSVQSNHKGLLTIEKGGHFAPVSDEYTDKVIDKITEMLLLH